jgi:CubicO group peptidase (beta-lactamase class C family)
MRNASEQVVMPDSSSARRSAAEKSCAQTRLDGFLHPDFISVAQTLRTLLRRYTGGAAVCVYHRGECVADLWGGVRDEAGTPWQSDTMAPSFSTTKGVASTLVHIMVDRGLLDYDERIATYWPEFAKQGKQDITLRQVLTHRSGLYHIRQIIDHADRMLDWDYMIKSIEYAEPIHPPGERTGYHGLTYGFIVGEVLQRVTGKQFSELVESELAEPLALDGMYVGTPDEVHDRAADLMWSKAADALRTAPVGGALQRVGSMIASGHDLLQSALGLVGVDFGLESIIDALAPRGITGFKFDSGDSLRAAIPAANGLFTARSLARMYAALAAGGELDGVRIVSETALAKATEQQESTRGHVVIPFDMRWRLGYHAIVTSRGFPRQAFGHFGFGGSGAWADPEHDLAVALIVNCGMGTPFGDTRTVRIGGAALASARRRGASQHAARHDEASFTDIRSVSGWNEAES